jgi:membrane-bound lytic murein transglycosylase B
MGGVKFLAMRRFNLILASAVILGATSCGNSQLSASAQSAVTTWELSEKSLFSGGKPANPRIATLLDALAAPAGAGQPVTEAEFRALLSRLSPEVYADKIIKYATPQSIAIQNKEHANFSRIFLKPHRVKAGVRFLEEHQLELEAAERLYQVQKKDIVAILMWESGLGEFVGNHYIVNVFLGQILYLDAARDLAVRDMIARGEADSTALTLGEAEAKRLERLKRSAAANLVTLLRLSKEKGVDPAIQKGSWGGAIGYVQFMPNSMPFARDGDGDGRIDLTSWPDAIHSVANFLHANGYGVTSKARRRAIRAYNPLDSYVDGVSLYADTIWKRYAESRKG